MYVPFQLAGGTVAGRDHRRGVPKNRQDDFCITRRDYCITAVIADGCSSGGLASRHQQLVTSTGSSEVGASLAVRLLSHALQKHANMDPDLEAEVVLEKARRELLANLQLLAVSMGPSMSEVVDRYFLFTMVGVLLTPEYGTFFGLGDGLVIVNGEVTQLEPDSDNRPIYLGYAITGSSLTDNDPERLKFKIVKELPLLELNHFLIGSDGAAEVIDRHLSCYPGSETEVGAIDQFWTEDRYFRNHSTIERQLNLMARDWNRRTPDGPVLEGGLLHDDTTIVVGRHFEFDPLAISQGA